MSAEGPSPPARGSEALRSANAFVQNKATTPARDLEEARIEELRREGGVFVDAVRATRMAMVLTDPSQHGNPIVFANDAFLALSGYSMEEVLGQEPHFMNGPGTDPLDAGRFRRMLEEGHDDVVETVQYAKDGRQLTATVLLSAFRDPEGRVTHHILSWLDVTRRVDAEETIAALRLARHALSESEQRFRAFVTSTSDAVYRMSPDWSQMRELQGQRFLASTEAPDESWMDRYILQADHAEVWRAIQQAVRTRGVFDLEHRVRRADGSEGWTRSRAVPMLGPDGEIKEWIGAARDVTHDRATELALQGSQAHLDAELERAAMLRELAARMVGEADVHTIYKEILATAIAITDADAGTVQVYEPDTRSLVLLVTQGIQPGMAEHFKHVDASSHTACGIALRTGSRTFVDFDTPPVGTDSCLHLQAGLHTAQATPLLSRDGSAIGMLNTHWRSAGHRSSDDELRFLDLLARQAADLIEQRRAQAALRISENRLRQFGEASQDVIWMRDAGTLQWSYLTPAFESIYGLSRTQAMAGDNYLGWMNLIVEQDRARVAECIERTRAGENVTFDYRIRRPSDGAVRWLRDTDFPILDASGHVTMIGGIGHDFTEAREAEVRLKTLVQGIPQLVWRATDPGQWTWASPQWLAYTGQSPEGSLGWGWLSALHPDDRERARSAWMQAMEKEGFEVDFRVCHAGAGEYRWFQTRATPVRSETGAIVEWLGTSTDVDELRQLQERQQVLVAELQHRTRNLMSVVQATAERTGANSEGLDDFRHRFTDRLQALARVQGLLSRLSETDRLPFDELIRSELQAVHGVDERVTLTGPAGIRLRSSMVQTLAMALHELATNAVKYGALSHGGGHLSVTWQMAEPDRNGRPRLLIEWRERGVRMPPPNSRPQGGGQGRELIEKALPYQLNAATRFQMTDDGVFCSITIPVSSSAPQAPAHG